ncbi:biopolymer transport protein ExbB [Pseudooceanicola antarcticus]|uniref:Biopolymer transport protein ExbB n=1 Tax=Pseudooceanicola antarcticus TaxID=1247613 RepID=A0A285IRD4_9RHOB|nr:MotA/TolQ/ExbB proton channel family protein [Pseudooceanicola antarcticus]PJE31851.1 flagellar motor protein MotA [Pseudooceanicola antarcticus]SNY50569.1 biopolymer transport protein ExbB [Pseudooceanicola antarcticus]
MAIRQAVIALALLGTTVEDPALAQQAPQLGGDISPGLAVPQEAPGGGIVLPQADRAPVLAEGPAPDVAGQTPAVEAPETAQTATPLPETLPAQTTPETTPAPRPGLAGAYDRARAFLVNGGPAIWAIAALSVVTVALILWKAWRLVLAGAWSRRMSRRAVEAWEAGDAAAALSAIEGRKGLRSRLTRAAMQARLGLSEDAAREETSRVARGLLASQGSALRALELISTIAPLLGLLGTVMGMIAAFQALQEAGSRADPSMLAGGIWEALLTTAAGMAVAIPASAALTWFEAVLDSLRNDLEDLSARIFVADLPGERRGGSLASLAAQ